MRKRVMLRLADRIQRLSEACTWNDITAVITPHDTAALMLLRAVQDNPMFRALAMLCPCPVTVSVKHAKGASTTKGYYDGLHRRIDVLIREPLRPERVACTLIHEFAHHVDETTGKTAHKRIDLNPGSIIERYANLYLGHQYGSPEYEYNHETIKAEAIAFNLSELGVYGFTGSSRIRIRPQVPAVILERFFYGAPSLDAHGRALRDFETATSLWRKSLPTMFDPMEFRHPRPLGNNNLLSASTTEDQLLVPGSDYESSELLSMLKSEPFCSLGDTHARWQDIVRKMRAPVRVLSRPELPAEARAPADANGWYCEPRRTLYVKDGRPVEHRLRTLIHEVAHAAWFDNYGHGAELDALALIAGSEGYRYLAGHYSGEADVLFTEAVAWAAAKAVVEGYWAASAFFGVPFVRYVETMLLR